MDIEKCLEILAERQKEPMNKIEDMPDVEGLEINGQTKIFDGVFLDDECQSNSLTEISVLSDKSGIYDPAKLGK